MELEPSKYDPTQLRLMDELCIVVDQDDNVLGFETKKVCHLNTKIREGLLHRAFSVFLFNEEGKLLLQQRASEKITFPEYWTNTCCSHPLYLVPPVNEGDAPDREREERNQLGVRLAAQRKLNHELGIPISELPLNEFKFLTRIHYKADSNDIWGEHEIDYILFIKRNVTLHLNPNEVKATEYVSQERLRELISMAQRGTIRLTPWFSLIADNFIFKWWDALLANKLDTVQDPATIHRMLNQ